jgi:myo-inositol-1(or 4)-monophosphatase
MDTDLTGLYETCVESARRAGRFVLERYQQKKMTVTSDKSHDIKLDVDTAAEELIKGFLGHRFPGHGFICEESGETGTGTGEDWIVDPLDGTVNFFSGIPHFCTSIAFRRADEYLVGAVYDPLRDELFSAWKGGGLYLNGEKLARRPVNSLSQVIVSGGFFKAESIEQGTQVFQRLTTQVKKIRFLGSAALDLCYLACGRFNAYLQHMVNEWDIAAAVLMAREAGNKIEIFERENGRMDVLAADPNVFDDIRNLVFPPRNP